LRKNVAQITQHLSLENEALVLASYFIEQEGLSSALST
jgi:hypothetical protein